MSRIGRLPIPVPAGVTVKLAGRSVQVNGPKGAMSQDLVDRVDVQIEGDQVVVTREGDDTQARSYHGLMRSLINNMIVGVSTGFQKELQVIGVGYRADVRGSDLVMQLGFSHPIQFAIPKGIDITADKTNKITVQGVDKQQVGQVAAVIRGYRPPDHYKGKGVRYVGEYVRIKAGKTA